MSEGWMPVLQQTPCRCGHSPREHLGGQCQPFVPAAPGHIEGSYSGICDCHHFVSKNLTLWSPGPSPEAPRDPQPESHG